MKKRKVLTKKAMILYFMLLIISIILIAIDCDNTIIFLITKLIAVIIDAVLIYCMKYIPEKYL